MVKNHNTVLRSIFRFVVWTVALIFFVYGIAVAMFLHLAGLVTALPVVALLLYLQLRDRGHSAVQRHLVRWRAVWFAAIAYTAYMLYFWRRDLGLEGVDHGHIIAKQAFTAALVTALLCLGYYIARLHPVLRAHGKSVWGVLYLLIAFLPLLLVTWMSTQPWFLAHTYLGQVSGGDWLVAIGLLVVFMSVIEIQEQTIGHNRYGLVEHHGHERVKRHLPPRKIRKPRKTTRKKTQQS
ncbi:MAG: hypothetical protein QG629_453 [Patescibacteria group bacterium]|nr:hypothetical protein [Candidatus Saccharibacteria bacterium]MDQ5963371.1 hypothetical protein [Patescibacteria group bacterium]